MVHEIDSVCAFACRLMDQWVENMKFHIEFTINRLTVRVQHRAAELAVKHQLGEVLFPAPHAFPRLTELPHLRYRSTISLLKMSLA